MSDKNEKLKKLSEEDLNGVVGGLEEGSGQQTYQLHYVFTFSLIGSAVEETFSRYCSMTGSCVGEAASKLFTPAMKEYLSLYPDTTYRLIRYEVTCQSPAYHYEYAF